MNINNEFDTEILLSIITINLNNADGLKATAQSISRLTYRYYEWLIIDGASKDSSLQVIKEFSYIVTKYISEPDNGIYNAMNKGVNLSCGNILLFLNSGDIFANETCLDFLTEYKFSLENILVGKSQLVITKRISPTTEDPIFLNSKKYFSDPSGLMPHQASFIPRQLLIENPYNEKLKIAGDLDFFIKMRFCNNINFILINNLIALCDENGISCKEDSQALSYQEACNIRRKYIGFYYYYYKIFTILKKITKKVRRIIKI